MLSQNMILDLEDFNKIWREHPATEGWGGVSFTITRHSMTLTTAGADESMGLANKSLSASDAPIGLTVDEKLEWMFKEMSYFLRHLPTMDELNAETARHLLQRVANITTNLNLPQEFFDRLDAAAKDIGDRTLTDQRQLTPLEVELEATSESDGWSA